MKKLFTGIFILYSFCAHSQKQGQEYTDSMIADIKIAKEDSNKAKLLYRIGNSLVDSDPQRAKYYIMLTIAHSQKIDFKKGIAAAYNSLGDLLVNESKYDSGMLYYQQGLQINRKVNYVKGEIMALQDMSITEDRRGNWSKAINYLIQVIPAAEKEEDKSLLGNTYLQIGLIYWHQKNVKKANEYNYKGLAIAEKYNLTEMLAEAHNNLAVTCILENDTIQAIKHFNFPLEYFRKTNAKNFEAGVLSNLGAIQKNEYENLRYKLAAKNIWDSVGANHKLAINNLGSIGLSYFNLAEKFDPEQLKKFTFLPQTKQALLGLAEKFLKVAIEKAKQAGDKSNYASYLDTYALLLKNRGAYKEAFDALKTSTDLEDSLYSQTEKNKIADLIGEREIAIRDKEIALNKIMASDQRKQQFALLAFLVLIVIIGGLVYFQSRSRKQINITLVKVNNKLDEANKLKAKFFAILSHDLRGPIASLVSYLNIREDNPQQISLEDNSRFQKNIKKSAEALLTNMDEVLLWSKGQMNNFSPALKNISADKIFTYLENSFEAETKIAITYSNPDDVMLYTDENYLQTIMQNLTGNAIKSLQNTTEPIITWTVHQHNEKTIFLVTDNGPGIKQEQLISLYEETLSPNAKTGFGLHLIRDLAKAINCTITVEKNINTQGTCFKLEL